MVKIKPENTPFSPMKLFSEARLVFRNSEVKEAAETADKKIHKGVPDINVDKIKKTEEEIQQKIEELKKQNLFEEASEEYRMFYGETPEQELKKLADAFRQLEEGGEREKIDALKNQARKTREKLAEIYELLEGKTKEEEKLAEFKREFGHYLEITENGEIKYSQEFQHLLKKEPGKAGKILEEISRLLNLDSEKAQKVWAEKLKQSQSQMMQTLEILLKESKNEGQKIYFGAILTLEKGDLAQAKRELKEAAAIFKKQNTAEAKALLKEVEEKQKEAARIINTVRSLELLSLEDITEELDFQGLIESYSEQQELLASESGLDRFAGKIRKLGSKINLEERAIEAYSLRKTFRSLLTQIIQKGEADTIEDAIAVLKKSRDFPQLQKAYQEWLKVRPKVLFTEPQFMGARASTDILTFEKKARPEIRDNLKETGNFWLQKIQVYRENGEFEKAEVLMKNILGSELVEKFTLIEKKEREKTEKEIERKTRMEFEAQKDETIAKLKERYPDKSNREIENLFQKSLDLAIANYTERRLTEYVLKNIKPQPEDFKDSLTLSAAAKREAWKTYRRILDEKETKKQTDWMVKEILINAPLVMVSGGMALGARAAAGKLATLGGRTVLGLRETTLASRAARFGGRVSGLGIEGWAFHTAYSALVTPVYGREAWDNYWQGCLSSTGMFASIHLGKILWQGTGASVLQKRFAAAPGKMTEIGASLNYLGDLATEGAAFASYGRLEQMLKGEIPPDQSWLKSYAESLRTIIALRLGGKMYRGLAGAVRETLPELKKKIPSLSSLKELALSETGAAGYNIESIRKYQTLLKGRRIDIDRGGSFTLEVTKDWTGPLEIHLATTFPEGIREKGKVVFHLFRSKKGNFILVNPKDPLETFLLHPKLGEEIEFGREIPRILQSLTKNTEISRRHFSIKVAEEGDKIKLEVKDLNSTFGTGIKLFAPEAWRNNSKRTAELMEIRNEAYEKISDYSEKDEAEFRKWLSEKIEFFQRELENYQGDYSEEKLGGGRQEDAFMSIRKPEDPVYRLIYDLKEEFSFFKRSVPYDYSQSEKYRAMKGTETPMKPSSKLQFEKKPLPLNLDLIARNSVLQKFKEFYRENLDKIKAILEGEEKEISLSDFLYKEFYNRSEKQQYKEDDPKLIEKLGNREALLKLFHQLKEIPEIEPSRGVHWLNGFTTKGDKEAYDEKMEGKRAGRFFLNVKPHYLPDVMRELARLSSQKDLLVYCKTLIDIGLEPSAKDLNRIDKMVFYFPAEQQKEALEVVEKIYSSYPNYFDSEIPQFTLKVKGSDGKEMRGVGFGESPLDERASFGKLRSNILAELIEKAHQESSSFEAICQKYRVDSSNFAFNLGGKELFKEIEDRLIK